PAARGTDQPILSSRASSAASLPPMRRPNHASRFEGIAKTKLQASRASDTETLQSQVNKAAEKRLSLSGLEVLHGRLSRFFNFCRRGIPAAREPNLCASRASGKTTTPSSSSSYASSTWSTGSYDLPPNFKASSSESAFP